MQNKKSFIEQLPQVRGQYRFDVDISKMCWFSVGGPVAVFYKPADAEDLRSFFKQLPAEIPYFALGVGSNLLVKDEGFKGVVIRLGRDFNFVKVEENARIRSGAAMLDLNLAEIAAQNSISGLEFFAGIPGTIGGALAMNAGAYGVETKDVLISAKMVTRSGEILKLNNGDFGFKYRGHNLLYDGIFVEATFQGHLGNQMEIQKRIVEIQQARNSTQPVRTKTGGSTFKNPEGHKAWQLIDQAGCRGFKIGGAQVSEMHCNFFINTGDATAQDLIDLIAEVKRRVYQASGILLQEEIKIL